MFTSVNFIIITQESASSQEKLSPFGYNTGVRELSHFLCGCSDGGSIAVSCGSILYLIVTGDLIVLIPKVPLTGNGRSIS